MIAECWDIDAVPPGNFQDGITLPGFDLVSVYLYFQNSVSSSPPNSMS